ncbi:fatty acid-binding protein 2-like [Pararge aegeria]|uniref:Jg13701 protein n=1 Tax=Pararge aegeria aegeria TaxID=348720 RepID=A0A8S4RMH0_9NEOP|nr:fatty acid-binding protein 2-like [Pararge aegeria]CAH2238893.1 jg13701 [Pararge aegeria aegeria]
MASYLGITFNHAKDENFKGFLDNLGIPPQVADAWLQSKPSPKLEKDGDSYIATTTDQNGEKKVLTFKSGVEFDEEILPGVTAKTTFTVEPEVAIQVQTFPDGRSITYRREYSGKDLVVVLTVSSWDGSAKRYYKAE